MPGAMARSRRDPRRKARPARAGAQGRACCRLGAGESSASAISRATFSSPWGLAVQLLDGGAGRDAGLHRASSWSTPGRMSRLAPEDAASRRRAAMADGAGLARLPAAPAPHASRRSSSASSLFLLLLAWAEHSGLSRFWLGPDLHVLHGDDVRRHRHLRPHHRPRGVLRRRPPHPADVQRHGHRGRLDERGLLHQPGRRPVPAGLRRHGGAGRRPGLCAGLDRAASAWSRC